MIQACSAVVDKQFNVHARQPFLVQIWGCIKRDVDRVRKCVLIYNRSVGNNIIFPSFTVWLQQSFLLWESYEIMKRNPSNGSSWKVSNHLYFGMMYCLIKRIWKFKAFQISVNFCSCILQLSVLVVRSSRNFKILICWTCSLAVTKADCASIPTWKILEKTTTWMIWMYFAN